MGCCTKTADSCSNPTYSASVENNGDSTFQATTRHSTFLMGTAGRGANPIDTFLAGLCGCLGHYARDYLREQEIAADGFTVKAGATPTPDGKRIAEIDVRIDVAGARLDDRQRAELAARAERCKIHNTLKACADVRLTVAASD
jgi:uncharacterized OsmC-like protein